MSDDHMPKVDISKLRQRELHFIKEVEAKNLERVQKLTALRRKNLITGLLLGVGVLGIYGYSMYAVKQETFLDDFEEPAKVHQ
ncbi:coiled-coil domain containing 56 [Leptinotarsa decemlineata]|uniref:coiled-coil domain containing 56 n=1 Tax=Leptinotarsa decemlineata TaxID=7539 RepID=UPI003D30AC08